MTFRKNINRLIGTPKSGLRKLWYCLSVHVFVLYITAVVNIFNHKRGTIITENGGSFIDNGFDLGNLILKDYDSYIIFKKINDNLAIGLVVFNLIWISVNNKGKWITIFKSFFVMIALIFTIRTVFQLSIVLPRPWKVGMEWPTCAENEEKIWGNPFLEGFLFLGKKTCYDFMFSGHSVFITVSGLMLIKYSNILILKIFVWILIFFNFFVMNTSRSHYLIDIEIGFMLSILLWIIYEYQLKLKTGLFYFIENDIDEDNDIEDNDIDDNDIENDDKYIENLFITINE